MTSSTLSSVGRRWKWAGALLLVAPFLAWSLSSPRGRDVGTGGAGDVSAGTAPFTIFVLGSSTARGEPYAPRLDFGLVASWLLGGRVGNRPIRVVNRSLSGKPSAHLVDEARGIAEQRYAPGSAVAFLYIGNNEFIGFDDHHDLSAPERRLFDEPTIDAEKRAAVVQRFRENIAKIIETLQGAGIAVIASTVAVNLKDWEPNRSVLADPGHAEAVRHLLANGARAQSAGDAEAALAAYTGILALEPGFALASKKAGDAARALGRTEAARAHYQAAVEHDGNPYRETSEQNRILRETAERYRVLVVDAVQILEAATPDHLIGFELMWDNCHPTLEGYARIAEGFVAEMEHGFGLRRQRAMLDLSALERDLGIDDAFMSQVYASRGQYYYMASTLTFDPNARLARAEHFLDQAGALAPESPGVLCSLAVLFALKGDTQMSLAQWRKAWALDTDVTEQRASHPHVAQIMQRIGIQDLPGLLKSAAG